MSIAYISLTNDAMALPFVLTTVENGMKGKDNGKDNYYVEATGRRNGKFASATQSRVTGDGLENVIRNMLSVLEQNADMEQKSLTVQWINRDLIDEKTADYERITFVFEIKD